MRSRLSAVLAALVSAIAIAVAAMASGAGSIATADDPYDLNDPPDCSKVVATPSTLSNSGKLTLVTLSGATDPDAGDVLSYTIDGVTQDEPVTQTGDATTPDAVVGTSPDTVFLRSESSKPGDGRIYRIAFTVSDGEESCSGTAIVTVPRKSKKAIDSGVRYDSFTGAPA